MNEDYEFEPEECDHSEIEWGGMEPEFEFVIYEGRCQLCGSLVYDSYELTTRTIEREKENGPEVVEQIDMD